MEVVPLFRTESQARLLAVIFEREGVARPIGHIARRAGVPMSTTSREVDRLEGAGLVVVERVGQMRLVSANWALPWASELASILRQTVGIDARITRALRDVEGIEEAYLFGSWVDPDKHDPRDIDVLVVGRPDRRALRDALRPVEDALHLYLNPTVVDRADWDAPDDPFLATVRARPLRRLDLEARA